MKDEPFVLCLTNTVAANFTANVLLAIGAKPAMIECPGEAAELAAVADAVLVNVGTVTPLQAEAMRAAIAVCTRCGIPWVLDPVAVQVLAYRRGLVEEFLRARPTLVRGNRAEIDFLGATGLPTLATGETDLAPEGEITGGVALLTRVTATGCAQGAIAAAFLGRGDTAEQAAGEASRLMKRAGERAYARAKTVGGFQMALLDALDELSPLRVKR